MSSGWMIFDNKGDFYMSPDMPYNFVNFIQGQATDQHWVITNIYFYPDCNGYWILGADQGISWYGNFPADLAAAAWTLKTQGHLPQYLSWNAPGCWAIFCNDGYYQLGPAIPSQIPTLISGYMQSNAQDKTRYSVNNLFFTPTGEWVLVGSDPGDEGDGTFNASSNFPADAMQALNKLPDHTSVQMLSFDGNGGWAMIDTSGNLYWSSSTPVRADLVEAVQSMINDGNSVTAIQFVANVLPYTLPASVSLNVTGPVDIQNWAAQINTNISNTLQTYPGITNDSAGNALPSGVSSAISIAATAVNMSVTCSFTDDSGKVPYDGEGAVYSGGNEAFFQLKMQYLTLDVNGIPVNNGNGGWTDFDPNGPVSVSLYGPGATNVLTGAPLAGAQPNQSISQTVLLPMNLSAVNTIVRLAYRLFLGDTRAGGGPMRPIGVLGEANVLQDTTYPLSYQGGANDPNWAYEPAIQLTIAPSSLLQLRLLPLYLLYCPPGSKSTESISLDEQVTYQWSITDTAEEAYSVSNSLSSSVSTKTNTENSFSISVYGFLFGVDLTSEKQITQTWDQTTTDSYSTNIVNSTTWSISTDDKTTWGPIQQAIPVPEDKGTPFQQSFWDDIFLLLLRPQFAVWDYPGLNALSLLSACPTLQQVSVASLAQGLNSQTPCSLLNGSFVLSPAECSGLLALDPFYSAMWQGADLSNGRWQAMGPYGFGTQVNTDGTVDHESPVQLALVVTNDNVVSNQSTLSYSSQSESKLTLSATQSKGYGFKGSFSYSIGVEKGTAGSTTGTQNSQTNTSTQDITQKMTFSYQTKNQADFKNTVGVTGSLDDTPTLGQTKGVSNSGQTVLGVTNTEMFSVGQTILVNPSPAANHEFGVIASIQAGVSLTMTAPLTNTHQAGESIYPLCSFMSVNVFRDLVFGGIAFQDTNAARLPQFPIQVPRRPIIVRL